MLPPPATFSVIVKTLPDAEAVYIDLNAVSVLRKFTKLFTDVSISIPIPKSNPATIAPGIPAIEIESPPEKFTVIV